MVRRGEVPASTPLAHPLLLLLMLPALPSPSSDGAYYYVWTHWLPENRPWPAEARVPLLPLLPPHGLTSPPLLPSSDRHGPRQGEPLGGGRARGIHAARRLVCVGAATAAHATSGYTDPPPLRVQGTRARSTLETSAPSSTGPRTRTRASSPCVQRAGRLGIRSSAVAGPGPPVPLHITFTPGCCRTACPSSPTAWA